jgi:5-formyltetrahydrofolate cyclo-ligase
LSSLSHDSGGAPERAVLRRELLARRPDSDERTLHDAALTRSLAAFLSTLQACCIGFYWPIRGEFDMVAEVIHWLRTHPDNRAALPVIHARATPLDFHLWTPDTLMAPGQYGIPEPQHTDAVTPDVLLIPCVGVDRLRYRMGYGGGYYDRTLASMFPRPRAIGIAYADTVVDTITPQTHDVPLDGVLTESGLW